MKLFLLILKNIGRNPLRSTLTALGTMVLVFVVTLVWSILSFLDQETREKTKNVKALVTERWQIPSQMPFSYSISLAEGAARNPDDVRPDDSMTWQFYGGTTDPAKRTRDSIVFAVAMDPSKITTMMPELESLPPGPAAELAAVARRLKENRQGIILGVDRMKALNRGIGDRFKIYSLNYKGIDLEFEVLGVFPPGRYDQSAVMNCAYLNEALEAYGRKPGGRKHPLAERSLNLVWLRVPDVESFQKLAGQIQNSPLYTYPALKCETESSGVAAFLDAFRDLIWGMRWLLAPATLVTLSLIIANAISISVRERQQELAVLKVLGFRPGHILALVLGEAVLLGTAAGFASASLSLLVINHLLGGIKFPLAFFGSFYIPTIAIAWGAAMGAGTALVGSFVPAWSARRVRVADVFAKVA